MEFSQKMEFIKEIEDLKNNLKLNANEVLSLQLLALAESSGVTYDSMKKYIIENKKKII